MSFLHIDLKSFVSNGEVESLWSDWDIPRRMMQVALWIKEKNEETGEWGNQPAGEATRSVEFNQPGCNKDLWNLSHHFSQISGVDVFFFFRNTD